MSFLSRLLGKAPASDRAEPSSAPHEPSPVSTPTAADEVAALPFGSRLLELAFDEANPNARAAQRRLIELIDAGSVSVEQLPWDGARRVGVLSITAGTADPANFEQVASRIDDPAVWKTLAMQAPTAKLRQLAAARIEASDDLRAVIKAARERDKNVYRIAKTKLDALHAEEKRAEERRDHMRSIAETIERHSYRPFDGAYVATVEHLEREWRTFDIEVPFELQTRVEAAFDRARGAIAEHIRVAGARAAHEAAVAHAGPLREATLDELRKILGALYTADEFDGSRGASLQDRLTKLQERWRDTLHYKPATESEAKTFDALLSAVDLTAQKILAGGTLQRRLETTGTEPSDASIEKLAELIAAKAMLGENVPELVTKAAALTREWREKRDAERASAAQSEQHIAQQVRRAQHALAAGRSRQAFGIRRAIAAKMDLLPRAPKALAERIQQLDDKLQEIQDWRSFAVTPKRSELIAQMQALVGSDQDPVELAEEIKRLQEEWKALAKGSADSDEDWARFHEAAQAAYAPCKVHFEAQAQQRERNLEQRKALVARLEQYEATTDWEKVEWKHVANALRAAKQEWRSAGATDRAATRPLERRFDELIGRVQERLDNEFAANLERKQALVEQAQRLAALDDLGQAATEVKRLQSAWRNVGLTSHQEGQRLWEEFKQHCDAVFEKRRSEHTERMAQLEQNEEQALALCIEVEELAQRTEEALFAAAARVRELRDAFGQIGQLPRDKAAETQRRFRRAVDEFEHAIASERQRGVDLAWDNFFDAANRVRLRDLDSADADDGGLRRHIDAIEHWPKGGKQAIEQRLAARPQHDAAENEAQLRVLAIRAEIATGAATPDDDQTQRRTMQLQALVKGIGRSQSSVREQLEALAFEWAAVGPVLSEAYEPLWNRFWRCWQLARTTHKR